jgi:hypothetical protein
MSDVTALENSGELIAALDDVASEQEAASGRRRELKETRRQLERPPEPVTADGNNDATTAAELETDGAGDEPGYRMTADRRVGTVALPVDGEGALRFGKPSGRASIEILEKIDEVEEEGGAITDFAEYLWGTLESWSLEDEYDLDWWADSVGMIDAVETARSVALGGNAPTE